MTDSATLSQRAAAAATRVRTTGPLVQCLTNNVTTNLVANTLLCVGASPAMADIPVEAGPFARVASGMLINVGTPSTEQFLAMLEAATAAHDASTPWVLDPVAAGALPVRTEFAHRLVGHRPNVIRGNASEVRALAGTGAGGKGVDAVDEVESAREAAVSLARSSGAVVAVSGEVDLVTDGERVVRIANGHPLLARITGSGCALGAVVAAFCAVTDDQLVATVAACMEFEVAAEVAAEQAKGPGSFAVGLLDALAGMDEATLLERGRLS